jgi:UDP-N-acetylmuramyl pentapeptide phosphotransferase/UDP-N-acetylglucosamine-1-phosphate transferase
MAEHFNIIDKPNPRSSHSAITFRGGGIIFPFAAILWFILFGFHYPWMIAGLLSMAVISFLDDLYNLSSNTRTIVHILSLSLLFWQAGLFQIPFWGIILVYIFTIGWINAFNFMDGINGITSFYSLVALSTFLFLYKDIPDLDGVIGLSLIILLILSALIFSFFNVRKHAKTFAGDIGSVSMSFLLAWFMLSLILQTSRIEYILFFAVYAIDSVFTILNRIRKGENIFKAHRSHLYQYLSNELKWPHLLVASIYAAVQLAINVLTICMIRIELMNIFVFVSFYSLLSLIYLFLKHYVQKGFIRIKTK